MRRFVLCAIALTLLWTGSIAAQAVAKVTNVDDYRKAMQTIGPGFAAVNKAVASGAMADAKTALAPVRTTMAAVAQFWVDNKKDDPAALAKDALAKMDALDVALAGTDTAAAQAAAKTTQGTCGACHGKYREQDPTTKVFNIKPGTL